MIRQHWEPAAHWHIDKIHIKGKGKPRHPNFPTNPHVGDYWTDPHTSIIWRCTPNHDWMYYDGKQLHIYTT